MPQYRALRDTLIAHEGRTVKAGDVFTAEFPKVKVGDKLVDMRLGDNLELVDDKPARKSKAEGDALV